MLCKRGPRSGKTQRVPNAATDIKFLSQAALESECHEHRACGYYTDYVRSDRHDKRVVPRMKLPMMRFPSILTQIPKCARKAPQITLPVYSYAAEAHGRLAQLHQGQPRSKANPAPRRVSRAGYFHASGLGAAGFRGLGF